MNSTSNNTSVDWFLETMTIVDNAFRYAGLTINGLYFILVLLLKQLQKSTLLYVHHASFANSFMLVLLAGYIFGPAPHFANQTANLTLCYMSEFLWCFQYYLRTYSILLLAIYRYIAVYKVNLYKKLNSSMCYMLLPLVIIYATSIVFPVVSKFAFRTTYSPYLYCLDGYSTVSGLIT